MGAKGCLYTCMHSVQHTCTASFADGSLQTVHIWALCCLVLLRADLTRIPALCCLLAAVHSTHCRVVSFACARNTHIICALCCTRIRVLGCLLLYTMQSYARCLAPCISMHICVVSFACECDTNVCALWCSFM
jgi:hypothetical protein